MDLQKLTQSDVADLLQLTTRQVRNLEADGMPAHARGGKKWYVWAEVLKWSRARWEAAVRAELEAKQPAGPSPLQAAELRRAIAEADRSETRAQLERGELVADADAVAEVQRFCERVRAGILSLRSRYQSDVLRLQSIPEAGLALDRIAAALLTDLQHDAGGTREAEDLAAEPVVA